MAGEGGRRRGKVGGGGRRWEKVGEGGGRRGKAGEGGHLSLLIPRDRQDAGGGSDDLACAAQCAAHLAILVALRAPLRPPLRARISGRRSGSRAPTSIGRVDLWVDRRRGERRSWKVGALGEMGDVGRWRTWVDRRRGGLLWVARVVELGVRVV